MPKYILNYFTLSGRAQAARLMFEIAGVEYEDNRIPFTEWPAVKSDEARFPLAQMPTLQVDDEVICQSSAIYRYLANSFGFYGESIKDKADIDQICETFNDYFTELMKIMFNKALSDEEKVKLENKLGTFHRKRVLSKEVDVKIQQKQYGEYFASDGCKSKLGFITKIFKKHNNAEKFFAGEKISIADLVLLAQNTMMEPAYPKYLDSYPELKALLGRIQSVEAVKKHLEANK